MVINNGSNVTNQEWLYLVGNHLNLEYNHSIYMSGVETKYSDVNGYI